MRTLLVGTTLPLILAGPAWAFPGAIRTVEKVVAPGRTLKVASMSVLDPACHSLGPIRIGLIEQPHNGQVEVGDGRDYPNFSALNARARCNTRKVPVTLVTYKPLPGYTGEDGFAMEFIGPYGNVGRIRYQISVR